MDVCCGPTVEAATHWNHPKADKRPGQELNLRARHCNEQSTVFNPFRHVSLFWTMPPARAPSSIGCSAARKGTS